MENTFIFTSVARLVSFKLESSGYLESLLKAKSAGQMLSSKRLNEAGYK